MAGWVPTLLMCLLGSVALRVVQAEVVAAAVLPHGRVMLSPNAYKGQTDHKKSAANELFGSRTALAQLLNDVQPELAFLVTPHGVSDGNNFTLYQHDHAAGTITAAGGRYSAGVHIDMAATAAPSDYLASQAHNISVLQPTAPQAASSSLPLDWGEVIPWHTLGSPNIHAVIMSIPARPGGQTGMVNELLSLGQAVGSFFSRLNSPRTLVVISADLAHTHSNDGPYGVSPAAAPFDVAMVQWAAEGDAGQLLNTAAAYVDEAKTCGFRGAVLLQGILSAAPAAAASAGGPASRTVRGASKFDWDAAGIGWRGQALAYGHPTYFGMMVAVWTPAKQHQQEGLITSSQGQQQQVGTAHAASLETPKQLEPTSSGSVGNSKTGHSSSVVTSSTSKPVVNVAEASIPSIPNTADDPAKDYDSLVGINDYDSSSTAYEVEDVEQLKPIRRECRGGWRARSKHQMLQQRAGTWAIV